MNLKLKAKILLGVMMSTFVLGSVKFIPDVCAAGDKDSRSGAVVRPRQDDVRDRRTLDIELCEAMGSKNSEKVQELLDLGANFSTCDQSCRMLALEIAIRMGFVNVVRTVLHTGVANINAEISSDVGVRKLTLLHWAVARGNEEIAEELLRHRANPNSVDCHGQTPLHWAAVLGENNIARVLLNHNADPNLFDELDNTPLHRAVEKEDEAVVKSLLAYGADPCLAGPETVSPMDMAFENGSMNIFRIMLDNFRHGN